MTSKIKNAIKLAIENARNDLQESLKIRRQSNPNGTVGEFLKEDLRTYARQLFHNPQR